MNSEGLRYRATGQGFSALVRQPNPWCRVRGRAGPHVEKRLGERGLVQHPHDAEVREHRRPICPEHDVGRLDISVNELLVVQMLKHLGQGDSNPAAAEASLDAADRSWGEVVDRRRILFQDRFNNGDHVRAWLNALREGGAR